MRPPIMIAAITGHLQMLAMLSRLGTGHELAICSVHTIIPTGKGILDIIDFVRDASLSQQTVKQYLSNPPSHTPLHRRRDMRHVG